MPSPEEFIDDLFHMYDPVDRHQRYLRERQLKGRRPTATKPVVVRRPGVIHPIVSRTTKTLVKKPVGKKLPVKSPEQRRREIKAQVEALKTRLDTLKKVLAELVRQAQARSGKMPADKKPDEKKTVAEKKKAAQASKDYRDKHKNDPPTPSQELRDLQIKINTVKKKIDEMRAKLEVAMQTSVRKPGPVGDRKQTLDRKENRQNGRSR